MSSNPHSASSTQKSGDRRLEDRPRSGYKFGMPKTIEQWLLFKYIGLEFTPLSKPFKTKQLVEKARSKYPEAMALQDKHSLVEGLNSDCER
jgi:hypothetical protein